MVVPAETPVEIKNWTRRHLLGLEKLEREEIELILDHAAYFKTLQKNRLKLNHLSGVVVANLFFEPSTRTKTSFSLAAKRLSADTVDFTASGRLAPHVSKRYSLEDAHRALSDLIDRKDLGKVVIEP